MRFIFRPFRVGFCACIYACASTAHAGQIAQSPTVNLYGALGLNTVPSARMEQPGTVRLNVGAADPYIHTSLGLQLTNRFYVGLRQSGEVSNLREDADRVFPGLDMKVKLIDEKLYRPEIALGFQSAFGHKRMAGEYLAFSKRYENFDFTAGVSWGRYGTRNSVPNPLDIIGSHFKDRRSLDGEKPNSPKDWFTGDTGFFAGLEYQTPLRGLSLKADWSSDSYKEERALGQDGFSAYSFGVNYQPCSWIETGIAVLDRDTVMATLSLKSMPEKWPFSASQSQPMIAIDSVPHHQSIQSEAEQYGLNIRNITPASDIASGQLYLAPDYSAPHQLSQAWRIIDNHNQTSGADILRLEPVFMGLKAPGISISRHDLEDAAKNKGSAEEIWRNVQFDQNLSAKNNNLESYLPFMTLRENVSLSEDDASLIHRTDVLATLSHQIATNFLSETSVRYNLFSNLDHLNTTRFIPENPIRSDINAYVTRRLAVERVFLQGFKSFSTNWHTTASAGFLDELFAGYHGEILYRPWGRNWAVGVEGMEVIKRDYEAPLNLGLLGQSHFSGYLNFYYEIPDTDITLHASVGQYLGQDKGGTLSLKNRYENGSSLEAFITATNMQDPDPYGGSENISSGLRFTLPLGSIRHIPNGSNVEVNAVPVARDAGQRLDVAHPLYDMTEPLSYRHIIQHWSDVTK